MSDFTLPPLEPAEIEWRDDTPYAATYGDSYFMPGRGLAESQAVFIDASGLSCRFAALPRDAVFVVGETGFGTGLNALLTTECFEKRAPVSACLHFYSAELHPLSSADLARALSHWPELAPYGRRLLEAWPPPAPGFHRIRLSDRVEITLMFGDAATLWGAGPDGIDAWFLDGFAPSNNPASWSRSLFEAMASRSRPGASVATFTAAGDVRRGLAAAGFAVERVEGFGGKRHRLVAQAPGRWVPGKSRSGTALVVGAGFAGCTTARALAERGWRVQVVDPALHDGAPKRLAAVLYTTASHHLNAQNRFYLSALLHARRWLGHLAFPNHESEGRLDGVVQHLVDPRVAEKTRKALQSGVWPKELLFAEDDDRVRLPTAGCLRPGAWCRRLLEHPSISTTAARVESLEGGASASARLDSGDAFEGEAVVLCTASATRSFEGLGWLPLRTVRGQVTFCRATPETAGLHQAHCHTGYVTPAIKGVHCVGATFDRQRQTPVIDPVDDQHNLAELERNVPSLWRALGGGGIEVVGHHAGLRCQSADTLPLVGPVPDPAQNPHTVDDRVWLNIAHGSKGMTHTPLCADLVADRLSGHPPATDQRVVASLAPERFIERRRRRDPDWRGE